MLLAEIEQAVMQILYMGPYRKKRQECSLLQERIVEKYNQGTDILRLLKLKSVLIESEKNAAQIIGMATMLRLFQTVNGNDKVALHAYCDVNLNILFFQLQQN